MAQALIMLLFAIAGLAAVAVIVASVAEGRDRLVELLGWAPPAAMPRHRVRVSPPRQPSLVPVRQSWRAAA